MRATVAHKVTSRREAWKVDRVALWHRFRETAMGRRAKSSLLAACLTRTATSTRCQLLGDKERERQVANDIDIDPRRKTTGRQHTSADTLLPIALSASKKEREREGESQEDRRWTSCTQTDGVRELTSRPVRLPWRGSMGEWARTSRGGDEDRDGDGRRVDEKRWGWLPNSNLGVGRVGKWAQCGVTLRAFALSPSAPARSPHQPANPPPLSSASPHPQYAALHLPRFNPLAPSTSASSSLSPPLSPIRHLERHPRYPLSQIDRP